MNGNEVAVHEIDGSHMHVVLDGLDEIAAAFSADNIEMGAVGSPDDLSPLRSHAYRKAAALLSVYRSRVDFLRHREIDLGSEILRYRFTNEPTPPVRTRSAIH